MAIYTNTPDLEKAEVSPSDMVWKEADSEELSGIIGRLMDTLYDKLLLTDEEIIDIIPDGFRHYFVGP